MGVASATLGFTATVLGTDDPPPTHDVRALTEQLRMVKSPAEIALIQKATDASIAVPTRRHARHQARSARKNRRRH